MKSITTLCLFFIGVVFANPAHATGSDNPNFFLDPSSILKTTGKYAWPSTFNNTNGYAKNVYFDFNQNPFSAGNLNEVSYNQTGSVIPNPITDSFTKTGDVKSFPSGSNLGKIGITDHNQDGTAVFSFSTLNLTNNKNTLYIWAEINVTTTGNLNNYITFSGLTNVKSSEIFNSSGTLLDKDSSGLFSYDMTGSAEIYDAYFALKNPGNIENLALSFNTGNGTALVNTFHVAMTPEPLSMALFATGVAVLFFFGRRRRAFQLA